MAENVENRPPVTAVTPEEIVTLYDLVGADGTARDEKDQKLNKAGQWNPHSSSWINPSLVARALWSYGRLAARRIVDIYKRLAALESTGRVNEKRLAALEAFKNELEAQGAALAEQIAALDPQALHSALGVHLPPPTTAAQLSLPEPSAVPMLPAATPMQETPNNARGAPLALMTTPNAAQPVVPPEEPPIADGSATVTSIAAAQGGRKAKVSPKAKKDGEKG